jgi:hypothetical protein
MNSTDVQDGRLLDWAVASRPIAGEAVSGDLHVVKPYEEGVLLAVVDGVGHGDQATSAAQTAGAVLQANPHESIILLIERCHSVLTHTRGVVMTIASLNALDDTVAWLGVGNVEGHLFRADANASPPQESVLLQSGLVGCKLPVLHVSVAPVAAGDLLVFATDGIQPGFAEDIQHDDPPHQIADQIMARHFKGNDDALVFVGRYRGICHE